MADAVPYLLRTKATKRARNRRSAIEAELERISVSRRQLDRELEDIVRTSSSAEVGRPAGAGDPAPSPRAAEKRVVLRLRRTGVRQGKLLAREAALRRELADLEGAIAGREAARRTPAERKDGQPAMRRKAPTETCRPSPSAPTDVSRTDVVRELEHDWDIGLWGRPKHGREKLKPLPTFGDALLNRLADKFRIPGLPHFLAVQVELQLTFDGLDAVVAGRDPGLDGLAFAGAICDCEIDMAVAEGLLRGERDMASRLRDLAEGGATGSDACGRNERTGSP